MNLIKNLFQDCSKLLEYIDDIKVLQETVLNHIGRSLHEISQGGKFKIDLDEQQEFCLSFSGDECDIHGTARDHLCDAEIHLFVVGDLNFYSQMLGSDNMSGSWCMWCQMAPNQWNREDGVPLEHQEEWTIDELKAHKILVLEGRLKKPVEIHGVVDFPLWDFIPVSDYIYPVLHGEIGLVNNALDAFYDILDDNIEVLTDEEKISHTTTILADAALETAAEEFKHFKEPSFKKENFELQKTERSQKRLETLKGIEDNPPPKLITAYKKLKDERKKEIK